MIRKLAEEWAAAQLAGHGALMAGGHNPEDPGGDFKPDPNKNHKTGVKIVAGTVAGSVIGSQIGGYQDARKDAQNRVSDQDQSSQIGLSREAPVNNRNFFEKLVDKLK